MKHRTKLPSMRIARAFHLGIILILALTFVVPLTAAASQGIAGASHSLHGLALLVGSGLVAGFVKTKEFKNADGKIVKIGQLDLEKGYYHATEKTIGAIAQMELDYQKEADEPSVYAGLSHYEIHMLKKSLRAQGKEVPLTAFEKQLLFHGLKVNGQMADKVEKFYSSAATVVLFPAYILDQILVGQLMDAPINDFVATRTTIEAQVADLVTMSESEEQRQTKRKTEGTELREFTIKVGDRTLKVRKFGGLIKASYEAIRFQRVNVFAKFIQRVGLQIAIDKMDELSSVLKNGDGNTGTAIVAGRTYTQLTTGAIGLIDVIGWANFATLPYKIDRFLSLKTHANEWYTALASMNNPRDQFNFINLALPRLTEWNRSGIALDTSTNAFQGIDSRFAVQEINNGPLLVESDRVIDRQLERTAISESTGYGLDENAVFRFTAI